MFESLKMYKIEYRKVLDLIPYVNNARKHSDEQILQIASSIKEFGFTNPILIDGENGIIAGHCRLLSAKKLNIEEVPTIVLKDLTEAQKKAYIIVDNKLALKSSWDYDVLNIELETLKELDFDISTLGFDFEEDDRDNIDDEIFESSEITEKQDSVKLNITCANSSEKEKLKEELLSRGFLCQ